MLKKTAVVFFMLATLVTLGTQRSYSQPAPPSFDQDVERQLEELRREWYRRWPTPVPSGVYDHNQYLEERLDYLERKVEILERAFLASRSSYHPNYSDEYICRYGLDIRSGNQYYNHDDAMRDVIAQANKKKLEGCLTTKPIVDRNTSLWYSGRFCYLCERQP